jgi:hypothetical protein
MQAKLTPRQIMEAATKTFNIDPYDINNGFCYEWAGTLLENLPNTEIWEVPLGVGDTSHAFVRYNGKFYDAECLDGVVDHMDLPLFKNPDNYIRHRQPIWRIDHNCSDDTDLIESTIGMTEDMILEAKGY